MSLVQDCVWLSSQKKRKENLGFLQFFSILKIEILIFFFVFCVFFFFSNQMLTRHFFNVNNH